MTATFVETAIAKFKALVGIDLVADIDVGFSTLAKEIDVKVMSYAQGATGSKPAAGQPNRIWRDTTTGALYYDTGTGWQRLMIGEAVTSVSIAGPYSAMAAITELAEQTPSATRPTLVCVTAVLSAGAPGTAINVFSNGVIVAQLQDKNKTALTMAVTFILPAGGKWYWQKADAPAATVKASYLTL